jgi:hypothetical protein
MEKWIKTYTYEEYNELEVELGVLYATNEKNFETYNEALTKINKLELQSQKMIEMLKRFLEITNTFIHPQLDHLRGSSKELIKETTEIK